MSKSNTRPKIYKHITMFNSDIPDRDSDQSDFEGPLSTELKSNTGSSTKDEKLASFGTIGLVN